MEIKILSKEMKEGLTICGVDHDINLIMLSKSDWKAIKNIFKNEKELKSKIEKVFAAGKKPRENSIIKAIVSAKKELRKSIIKEYSEEIREYGTKKSISIYTGNAMIQDMRDAKKIAKNYNDKYLELKKKGLLHKEIIEKLDYMVDRIAVTESNHVLQNQLDIIYPDAMFQKRYNAILDRRACDFCRKKDKKIIKRFLGKKELPPFHANCRCFVSVKKKPDVRIQL